MEKIAENQLLLYFQTALLFNVTFHTRLIVATLTESESRKLTIWVYLDRPPTEDEKDVYYSVSAEVTGHFAELYDSEVHFLTGDCTDEDSRGKLTVFARCDYLDFEGNLIS